MLARTVIQSLIIVPFVAIDLALAIDAQSDDGVVCQTPTVCVKNAGKRRQLDIDTESPTKVVVTELAEQRHSIVSSNSVPDNVAKINKEIAGNDEGGGTNSSANVVRLVQGLLETFLQNGLCRAESCAGSGDNGLPVALNRTLNPLPAHSTTIPIVDERVTQDSLIANILDETKADKRRERKLAASPLSLGFKSARLSAEQFVKRRAEQRKTKPETGHSLEIVPDQVKRDDREERPTKRTSPDAGVRADLYSISKVGTIESSLKDRDGRATLASAIIREVAGNLKNDDQLQKAVITSVFSSRSASPENPSDFSKILLDLNFSTNASNSSTDIEHWLRSNQARKIMSFMHFG